YGARRKFLAAGRHHRRDHAKARRLQAAVAAAPGTSRHRRRPAYRARLRRYGHSLGQRRGRLLLLREADRYAALATSVKARRRVQQRAARERGAASTAPPVWRLRRDG